MSAGIIDSQSTKMHEGGEERGFNAGKKATGRKRHILVDTLGLALLVLITAVGDMLDRDGAKLCLQALVDRITGWCRLQPFWADGSYLGCLIDWVRIIFCWTLNIVKKLGDQVGFQALSKRWIVERTVPGSTLKSMHTIAFHFSKTNLRVYEL